MANKIDKEVSRLRSGFRSYQKLEWMINDKDLHIISKLFWKQSVSVRTESGMTSEFKIKKGGLCTITKFIQYIHWENFQRGRKYERSKCWRS